MAYNNLEEYLVPASYFGQSAGKLWLWGNNLYANLGDNTTANKSSPIQTVAGGGNWNTISAGQGPSVGIKTDGTLWLWGKGNTGQLGDDTQTNKSSPVQTIAGGYNWKSVDSSGLHTLAVKTDGTLWAWGYNSDGQLGTNNTIGRSSPVQTTVAGTDWKSVYTAAQFSAAIKTNGTLWTWGQNSSGQLGTNVNTQRNTPGQTIAGGSNWRVASCGGSGFMAAIKTDGTLWTWGNNTFGALGDNTTTSRSSPVQTIAGGTNWKQVACAKGDGGYHTAAVKTDGTLWLWGYNGYGELGSNARLERSSPVQTVATGTNWKQVSCGASITAAVKTDGSLWLWGQNTYGQLGDNTRTHKSSPVQTVAGGTVWKSVSCGASHVTALAI